MLFAANAPAFGVSAALFGADTPVFVTNSHNLSPGSESSPVGGGDALRGRHLTEAAQPQAWLTWGAPPPPGGSFHLP
jgi:hypothetical protein